MPVTDPIADMLTRIRNANVRRLPAVRVRGSKLALAVADALQREGFIGGCDVEPDPKHAQRKELFIRLKYGASGERVITRIVRVSRPGRRVYMKAGELRPVLRGLGVRILSTPKGVLSDRQARQANVGGEVLCIVE